MTTSLLERPLSYPEILDDLTRRELLTGAAALFVLGACGDKGDRGSGAGTPAGAGFPVEVTGALGPVRVERRPERVVTVGFLRDPDIAVALGVVPVGIATQSLFDGGLSPWLVEALGPARPMLLEETVNLEQIALLRPDLILATDDYALADNYKSLSAIAPTLSYKTAVGSEPWDAMATHVGPTLGRTAEAAEVVARVRRLVADAAAENPGFDGRTFSIGVVMDATNVETINRAEDASAAFLSDLGLVLAPKVAALPEKGNPNRAIVSLEQLDLLDADVMFWVFPEPGQRQQLEAQPLFQALPAVQRGSYVPLDLDVALGIGFPSVLSIPYALSRIVPKIQSVLRG